MTGFDVERGPGRPRDPDLDDAILSATTELLCEAGFAGTTVEAVAERAGVGKATIYRRWPSREDLLLAAGDCLTGCGPVPDTGSLRDDLVALMSQLVGILTKTPAGALLPAMVEEAARNPELRSRFDAFVDARREPARQIVQRALDRGELRADLDRELVVDLLSGPLFLRILVTGAPIDADLPGRVVDAVLGGVASAT